MIVIAADILTRMNTKAIIFDMDGTLTEYNSWLEFTKALGASVEEHTKIYNDLLAGKSILEESKEKLFVLWQRSENAHKEFIDAIFVSWQLKHNALEVIHDLQDSGFIKYA